MSAPEPPQIQQLSEELQAMIGGELPGEGLLFPDGANIPVAPTDPEKVRLWLLRAIEYCATISTMPYGETGPADASAAALRFSQSYLLLDPTVDENGVPIGLKEAAKAEGQIATQQHQASITPPPRIGQNAAEKKVAAKNEGKTRSLRSARGQTPRPQPRLGS